MEIWTEQYEFFVAGGIQVEGLDKEKFKEWVGIWHCVALELSLNSEPLILRDFLNHLFKLLSPSKKVSKTSITQGMMSHKWSISFLWLL